MPTTLHRRVALAVALAALALSGAVAGAPVSIQDASDARADPSPDRADRGSVPGGAAEENVSASFVADGERLVLRNAPNQTVRLRTDAEPGSEVTVRLKSPRFLRTTTAVVGENGTAAATFDLSDVSEMVPITVDCSDLDAETDGLLVNESAAVHRNGSFVVRDPAANYTLRGRVSDPTVRTLDVRYSAGGTPSEPQTVAVGGDRRFTATFDLSLLDAGTRVDIELGGIPREVTPVVVTEDSRAPVVYAFVEEPANLALDRTDGAVLVHAAPNQTIRGTTNFRPGTELVVTAENAGTNVPADFELRETVTVREDGTFAATLNFSAARAGTNFTVTVERGIPLAEVEGRVVNESVEISEAGTTASPTTYDESGFFTTDTTTPDDGTDGHADEFGVPGFGVPAALAALLAGLALARRTTRE